MKKYRLNITDRDGVQQEYNVRSRSPWTLLLAVERTMRQCGDFYGHVPEETMNVHVEELVENAQGDFIDLYQDALDALCDEGLAAGLSKV